MAFNQSSETVNRSDNLLTGDKKIEMTNLAVPEEVKLRKARGLSQEGLLAVRCAWGKVQEASSLLEAAQLFPSSKLYEIGLCMLDIDGLPAHWGFSMDSLPCMGASPDALFLHPPSDQSYHCFDRSDELNASHNMDNVEHLLDRLKFDESLSNLQRESTGVHETQMLGVTGNWEPLEVKNTCPFAYDNARKGGRRKFIMRDCGPKNKIEPTWIPQLQLQMLCSKTKSILLVSRSISRGLNIFRLHRAEEYIRLMLTVVAQLYTEHVLARRPPAKDVFAKSVPHQKLLALTKKLAATATIVSVDATQVDRCFQEDVRFFLD